jgi:hypothetical protein
MKYRILIMSLLLFVAATAQSQTWNEWFRQKKTQKKYLIQQIAALKVYLKYLKQGYNIAKKGMRLVGDIKEGNFNSHKEYFGSLREVNEMISNSGKVSTTMYYETAIIELIKRIRKDAAESDQLTRDERKQVFLMCDNMLALSDECISNLKNLVTDGELEMKDDERIKRLVVIYEESKERFHFTRQYFNANRLLILQREKEAHDVEMGRAISTKDGI